MFVLPNQCPHENEQVCTCHIEVREPQPSQPSQPPQADEPERPHSIISPSRRTSWTATTTTTTIGALGPLPAASPATTTTTMASASASYPPLVVAAAAGPSSSSSNTAVALTSTIAVSDDLTAIPVEPAVDNVPWPAKTVSDVVVYSTLRDPDTYNQLTNVVDAFNSRSIAAYGSVSRTYVSSWLRGERVDPEYFGVFQRNQIPCISQEHAVPIARRINVNPNVTIEQLPNVPKNSAHFEACGSHIINVPVGKFAKVFVGTAKRPLLLGEGPHVFHDPTLEFNSQYVNQADVYIQHGTLHLLRVQPGRVAKVWYENKPVVLRSQSAYYVIDSAQFRFEAEVDQNEPLISHTTIHWVRVPRGKLAKVWVDNQPRLLESRVEWYEYRTPYFSVGGNGRGEGWLVDSASQVVTHGSINRVLPNTGEVCVAYDNGNVVIIPPSKKPFLVDDPTFKIDGFLSTNVQTVLFPSEETKALRRAESSKLSDDEVNYDIFTTRDSLKVGIKILLVYQIRDARMLLQTLKRSDVLRHIERICTVDLGKMVQNATSQDFLSFTNTKAKVNKDPTIDIIGAPQTTDVPSFGPPLQHITDIVRDNLARDLAEYGVELIRLNIETPKVLDKEIARSMEMQSITTAKSNAEESMLAQQFRIAKTRADQDAKVISIKQAQDNSNKISAAQAELEAARLRAEAVVVAEEGAQRAAMLRGQRYVDMPVLRDLEMMRLQTEALGTAKVSLLVTPEVLKEGLGALFLPSLISGGTVEGAGAARGVAAAAANGVKK